MAFQLDNIDKKILTELQIDASQSLEDIAKKVGASKTPVWNRIKKLRKRSFGSASISW
jgi:Lrp/AsnC family transcriptional regulator